MSKILITGVSGFCGSHLAEYCLSKKDKVFGTMMYHHLGDEERNIEKIKNKITLFHGDLTDYGFVYSVIEKVKPDVIFHLAAQSYVKESFDAPEMTLKNNIFPELYIFESIRRLNLVNKTVLQIACSSEEYGMVNELECPITEYNDLRPLSTYAVSKITQDFLAQQYHQSYGIKTVITRAFNHEGPRRGRMFVTSTFAEQVAKIELGLQENVIKVGNLEAERDFTDVRDMVRAYYLAVNKCNYGIPYNIGSGKCYRMSDILDILKGITTFKGYIRIEEDKKRMRASDVPLLLACNVRFVRETDWKPEISFEKTMKDLLDYWRNYYGRRKELEN